VSAADYARIFPRTLTEWRRWLRANHATARGVWVVSYRRATDKRQVPYVEAVEEALCWGWIDGQVQSVDEERLGQLFTPRRAGSGWAKSNKDRVRRLIKAGRMQPGGLAKIAAAKRDGSWTLLDTVETVTLPADLRAALRAGGVASRFDALSKTGKRQHLYALVTAKRPETRTRRIAAIVRAVRT
jgi:uncharacterized protein YdeI (YjbR/CyaY-like superfamily)